MSNDARIAMLETTVHDLAQTFIARSIAYEAAIRALMTIHPDHAAVQSALRPIFERLYSPMLGTTMTDAALQQAEATLDSIALSLRR